MINAAACVGTHDILFITLDTLRYDVAVLALEAGETPHLAKTLPDGKWEKRHSPGSFTYAAHHAFFAGFLPTPITPGPHDRLFASQFPGSETTSANTFVFDTPDILSGLAQVGYRTVCIGGVGFFNKMDSNPLGCVFPNLFDESYWQENFGVTEPASTEYQIDHAEMVLSSFAREQRLFLFVNISAMHQPNCHYMPGATKDSARTQQAALAYVDTQLGRLFTHMEQRAPVLTIICSDHGTTYGEDGYQGHRLAHPSVWEVPYMETILPYRGSET